jgi:hypothetical protein
MEPLSAMGRKLILACQRQEWGKADTIEALSFRNDLDKE